MSATQPAEAVPEPLVVRAGPIEAAVAVEGGDWPSPPRLAALVEQAVGAVLAETGARSAPGTELSILFADDARLQALNSHWRGADKPTNVLSFPAAEPVPGDDALPAVLGDIVLAAETIAREAAVEGKPLDHHILHLLVHGFLHLTGHDHGDDAEADAMEELERRTLARLAVPDPYS